MNKVMLANELEGRTKSIEDIIKRERYCPFTLEDTFEDYLNRLRFLERLKQEPVLISLDNLDLLSGYMRHPIKKRIDDFLEKLRADDDSPISKKNARIAGSLAYYDLDINDNYNLRFITDSNDTFLEMRTLLENNYKIRQMYRIERYESKHRVVVEKGTEFHSLVRDDYMLAGCLDLTRFNKDANNTARLICHGGYAGIVGSVVVVADIVQEYQIPTRFGELGPIYLP